MDASISFIRRIIPETSTSFIVPPFPLDGSVMDLWFSNNRYYSSLTDPLAVTDVLSCSRASIGYAKTATGVLTQFASDTLRITNLGLLVEDEQTNYMTHSQTLASLNQQNTSTVDNQGVAPDGTTTMSQVSDTAVTAQFFVYSDPGSFTANTKNVASIFVRDVDRRYCGLSIVGQTTQGRISVLMDLQTGTVVDTAAINGSGTGAAITSTSVESYANSTYRLSLCGIVSTTDTFVLAECFLSDTNVMTGGLASYLGSGKSIYAWGFQFEKNITFASSYIPTTTTSAVRAIDSIIAIGDFATLYKVTARSALVAVSSIKPIFSDHYILYGEGGPVMDIHINSDNTIRSYVPTVDLSYGAIDLTIPMKIAFAADASGRSLVANGGTVVSDSNSALWSTSTLRIFQALTGSINGYATRLTTWNTRLYNDTIQALTLP